MPMESARLPLIGEHFEIESWRDDLRGGVSKVTDLSRLGLINEEQARQLEVLASQFKVRVSRYYLSLIDWTDPGCPIRRQAIPTLGELESMPVEMPDPTGDQRFRATPLLIHRYPDRVLLTPTLNCPMYCRYCFRKVGLNEKAPSFAKHWKQTLSYLSDHPQIEEVILSGGDPLLLPNRQLFEILSELRQQPNLKRIRIHSRVPVTLPSRVTSALCEIFREHEPILLVTHFNHPRELTDFAKEKLRQLRAAGVVLSNQSVLLKGVNDCPKTLRDLCVSLLTEGAIPHYVHHPDLTIGTHHFRISLDEGLQIYQTLRGTTSGLAIPTYVMEIPGGGGKVVVDGADVVRRSEGVWCLRSPMNGEWVTWHDPIHTDVQREDCQ